MKYNFLTIIFIVIVVNSFNETVAQSIVNTLIVRDDSSGVDTLYFGYADSATYCIDEQYGEHELPPIPPDGVFDARFVEHRNQTENCFVSIS